MSAPLFLSLVHVIAISRKSPRSAGRSRGSILLTTSMLLVPEGTKDLTAVALA